MRSLMSLSNLVRLCQFEWISFLLPAVPIRSRATFIKVRRGCMISPEGWVTRCIGAIWRRKRWGPLEHGSISTSSTGACFVSAH